jgi:hypothetical protein
VRDGSHAAHGRRDAGAIRRALNRGRGDGEITVPPRIFAK